MLRVRPAAAFALLNHILINGFFFNQGFAIAFVPFKHSVHFVPPRKLSDPYVHAGSPNERVVSRRSRYRQDLLQRKNGKLGQSSIGRRALRLRRCSRSLGALCPEASAGCACRRILAVAALATGGASWSPTLFSFIWRALPWSFCGLRLPPDRCCGWRS
jgi:hypothetical protein